MLLKLGSRGEDVKTLQMTLKLRGYSIGSAGPDGVFGADTERAVKAFQADHNLEPDGVVGPATQEALHHDYSGNTDYGELIKMGSSGPQVAEVQRLLIKAGFSVGPAGADGIFGQGTYEAVRRFQESRGLDSDGIIGPATKKALKNVSSSSGISERLLKLGSRGEDVKTLQMTLKLRGYSIGSAGPDGVFGADTERAVKAFQADHNLEPDGVVGPATQEALHHDYSGNTDYGELIKMGSSGPQVAEVQRLLIKAGFSVGPAGADGIFGQGTYEAVRRFQESRGLDSDGIVGPATKSALGFGSSGNNVDYVGGEGTKGFLEIAKSQLGYHEQGVNVTKYGAWYGMQDEWCAMFVSWCAKEAGILNKVVPSYSWCESGATWYKRKDRYGWRGKYTPKPGDVVFFYNPRKKAPYYHTGIVEYVEGNNVHTIEGNADDAVRRRTYSLSYSNIQGYGMNGGIKNGLSKSDLDKINNNKLSKLLGVNFNFETKEKVFMNSKYFKISYQYSNKLNIGDGEGFSFEYKNGKFEGSTMATGIANLALALGKASTAFENTMNLFDGLDLTISAGIDEGKAKVSIKTTQKISNNDSVELILNIIFKMTKDDIIDSIKKEVSDIVNLLYDNLGIIGIAIFIIGFIAFIVVSDGTGALVTPAAVSAIAAVLLAKKIP